MMVDLCPVALRPLVCSRSATTGPGQPARRAWYACCSSSRAELVLDACRQGVQQVLLQLHQHLLLQLLHRRRRLSQASTRLLPGMLSSSAQGVACAGLHGALHGRLWRALSTGAPQSDARQATAQLAGPT